MNSLTKLITIRKSQTLTMSQELSVPDDDSDPDNRLLLAPKPRLSFLVAMEPADCPNSGPESKIHPDISYFHYFSVCYKNV